MTDETALCVQVDISDRDIFEAMKEISGYLDITPGDFKEVYLKAYRHALERLVGSVVAQDIMIRKVVYARDTDQLKAAAAKMSAAKVSGIPVLDDQMRVVGILTEKDFFKEMARGVASNFMDVISNCLNGRYCLAAPARDLLVSDVMTKSVITVSPKTAAMEIADLLSRKGINRVPVVDESNQLLGIICRSDLMAPQVKIK